MRAATHLPRTCSDAEVLESIDGAYRLSNGQKLALASQQQSVVADFGRRHQIPLAATAPDRFESRNGLVWVRYEADPRGRYVDVC